MFVLLRLIIISLLLVSTTDLLAEEDNNKEEHQVSVKVIAVITMDDQGVPIRYPTDLAYDPDMDELYCVVGGQGKIIVYGANFFPTVSLGPGRGAIAPRSVFIDPKGMVYVSQGVIADKKPTVTIYNPAFFPVDTIDFENIPEGENFSPRNMTIGLSGNIYITGLNNKGVMVFDPSGRFDHWLKPNDTVFDTDQENLSLVEKLEDANQSLGQDEQQEPDLSPLPESDDQPDMTELLPPELLPNRSQDEGREKTTTVRPVRVTDVTRDSEGHLYILSEETSKIYVYSPTEELLFSFGQKGGSTGKMSRPRSLVVDEKKKAVYVADYMRHTILIYNLGGKYMYEFGGMGTDPGWFQYPSSITLLNDGYLAVADLFNHRIQILDVDFKYSFSLFGAEKKESNTTAPSDQSSPENQDSSGNGEDILQPSPL